MIDGRRIMFETGKKQEVTDAAVMETLKAGYKEIKPEGEASIEDTKTYWDNLFAAEIPAEAEQNKEFVYFWHEYEENGCFSNWYMSDFECEGKKYCCVEQYMMAEKARLFEDYETCDKIMQSKSPEEIKALGRAVQPFDAEKWDELKLDVMYKGNFCKYSQNEDLRNKLLDTGTATLAEASPYDRVWGIGMTAEQAGEVGPDEWKGENQLGKCLEKVRHELQNEQ